VFFQRIFVKYRVRQQFLCTATTNFQAAKIETKNIPAVTPIGIDGGHIGVSHSLINA
jgi:hypothetical protein